MNNKQSFNPLIQVNDFYITILVKIPIALDRFNPLIQVNDFYEKTKENKTKKEEESFNPLIQVNDFYSTLCNFLCNKKLE